MVQPVRKHQWLLPDGMDELLPPDAWHLEMTRRRILDRMTNCGYELIMPPLVEYLDSLLTDTAEGLAAQTFTLLDQVSGRQLGIRADVTSQAARIDAHSLPRKGITRLCYAEQTAHARAARMLASRLPVRAGAELFGHAGVESDVEIMSLLVSCLRLAAPTRVTLEIGDVSLFFTLMRRAGLKREVQQTLFHAVQRKAFHEVEALAKQQVSDPELADLIALLPRLVGGSEVLEEAARAYRGISEIDGALGRLTEAARAVQAGSPDTDLLFDLAELRGFDYHTGIVFSAYLDGCDYALARGGRYDEVGARFGRARQATGFDLDLKEFAACISRAEVSASAVWVGPELAGYEGLRQQVESLRASGRTVICGLAGEVMPEQRCSHLLLRTVSGFQLEALQPGAAGE